MVDYALQFGWWGEEGISKIYYTFIQW